MVVVLDASAKPRNCYGLVARTLVAISLHYILSQHSLPNRHRVCASLWGCIAPASPQIQQKSSTTAFTTARLPTSCAPNPALIHSVVAARSWLPSPLLRSRIQSTSIRDQNTRVVIVAFVRAICLVRRRVLVAAPLLFCITASQSKAFAKSASIVAIPTASI